MVATACAQSSCIDQYGVYTKCLFTFVKRPKVTPARAQHVRTARRYPVLYGGTRLYSTIRFRDYGFRDYSNRTTCSAGPCQVASSRM